MNVRGSIALVVGAAGSIGSVTARAFVAAGADVVLADLPEAPLAALANDMQTTGARAKAFSVDLTQRESIERLVSDAMAAWGRVDVLANIAGIGSSPSLLDSADEDLERVIAVNLLGAARLMHAIIPAMKRQGRGSIINIGSVAGEAGVMGIYSASKFGLRGLSDTVRREVKQFGIDVTLIEPGFVRSRMNPEMSGLPEPDIVARAVVDAVEHPRRIRIVPASYVAPVWLVKTFPGIADLVFGSAWVQRRMNRDSRETRAKAAAIAGQGRG